MDQKALNILNKERICAISINLADGTPHVAPMAFVDRPDPFEIYMLTDKDSKKCQMLLTGNTDKASFAIGFSEAEMECVQMDGEIVMATDPMKIEEIRMLYFKKFPDHRRYEHEGTGYLIFTPKWWRYTDFKPVPNLTIESDH